MGGTPKYPQFPIRIDPMLIHKTRLIAYKNSRSTAKEIEQLIIKHIADYEELHGEITQSQIDAIL